MQLNQREITWGYRPSKRGDPSRRASNAEVRRRRRPKKVEKLYAVGEQVSLAHKKTRGGPRPGAGRPPASKRPNVAHRRRAELDGLTVPSHLTMRRAKGLPSLRSERLANLIRAAIKLSQSAGFRVVHYSIQADHLHLIVEAGDKALLSKGMRSFAIRVALLINRRIFNRRAGKVWGDRYHRHDLPSPLEVRNALVYVLNNHLKHGVVDEGLVDPKSSAPWFKGFMHRRQPPPDTPDVAENARTWVLDEGWIRAFPGFIHIGEVPKALRAR